MAVYTDPQLQALWIKAGGKPSAAPMAAAIAMAESSGSSSAHNRSGATGLWQILGNPFPGNAYDPLTNAKMAIAKSGNGTNWTPWTTYTSGAYQPFLKGNHTVPAVAGSTDPATQALLNSPSSTPGSGSSGLFGATQNSQLLYGTVWIGLLAMAIYLLYTGLNRSTGGQVTRAVQTVGTAAKTAAKTAKKVPVE